MKKFLLIMAIMVTLLTAGIAQAALVTTDLNGGITPSDMANSLLGGGIAISNVVYTGANNASGMFSGGTGIIGFESGILLTSGSTSNVIGPNNAINKTTSNDVSGSAVLDALVPGYSTYDASLLSFDFIPSGNFVQFQYVFSSEEYNEWVGSEFNDVFGFFVNGVNYALIPGTSAAVAINNVNNGLNNSYYIDNTGGLLNTQMDGLTVMLNMQAPVNPGVTNSMLIGIADAGDYILDSAIFIKGGSFEVCGGTGQPPCCGGPDQPPCDNGAKVPEPSTILLLGSGLLGLGFFGRKRMSK